MISPSVQSQDLAKIANIVDKLPSDASIDTIKQDIKALLAFMRGQFSRISKQEKIVQDISKKYSGNVSKATPQELAALKRAEGQISAAQKMLDNQSKFLGQHVGQLSKKGVVKAAGASEDLGIYAELAQKQYAAASKALGANFRNSKVVKAFASKYVDPTTGTISQKGESTAQQIQMQDKFVRKLVQSFAALPIFAKAGRAFQQLGMMTMMSGVAKFRQGGLGNQLLGLGQIGLGLAEYLAPAMASAFGTVMTEVVAKKISEAVTLGMIKGSAGKVGGFVGKLALPLAVLGAIGFGTKDLGKQADRYAATGQTGKARATKAAQGGLAATGLIGAIGMAIAAIIGAPLAPIIAATAAIAGVTYLIGKNVDKIFGFFATAKSWLTKLFDKINPWGKGDKHSEAPALADKVNPYYTQQNVDTSKLVQAVANKKVGKPSEFQTDRFRIIQYGTSNFETGGYTVLGSQYSKEQLEAMGAAGKGNLETLKGLNLANTFTNDARVARAGSSAILQAVQAKTGESLLITSAMASKTSTHQKGLKGHEAGQKFDFSAAGLNEAQAKAKAAKLYATGYFSHAEAEYDKETKQWHIDARISDAAYKTLEGIQKQQQDEKIKSLQKTSPRVKEAPGTAKVADVVNGSLGLRNSLYGPALGI